MIFRIVNNIKNASINNFDSFTDLENQYMAKFETLQREKRGSLRVFEKKLTKRKSYVE